jgi:preprotein translocase subunit YajC
VLGSLAAILAQSDGSSSGSGLASILLFLVPMGLIFYFLIIRPQRRQRDAQRRLIESVDVGDEIVTIGGVYGTVRALDDESLTVEVAPGVEMRFARGAVARKLTYEDEYDTDADVEDQAGGSQDDEEDEAEPAQPRQDWRSGPWFGRGSRRRGRDQGAGDQT